MEHELAIVTFECTLRVSVVCNVPSLDCSRSHIHLRCAYDRNRASNLAAMGSDRLLTPDLEFGPLQAIANFAELECCNPKRFGNCCTFNNDLEKLRPSAVAMH